MKRAFKVFALAAILAAGAGGFYVANNGPPPDTGTAASVAAKNIDVATLFGESLANLAIPAANAHESNGQQGGQQPPSPNGPGGGGSGQIGDPPSGPPPTNGQTGGSGPIGDPPSGPPPGKPPGKPPGDGKGGWGSHSGKNDDGGGKGDGKGGKGGKDDNPCPPDTPPPSPPSGGGGQSQSGPTCSTCSYGFQILMNAWIARHPGGDREDFINASKAAALKEGYSLFLIGFWGDGVPCSVLYRIWLDIHPKWDGNICDLTDPLPGVEIWTPDGRPSITRDLFPDLVGKISLLKPKHINMSVAPSAIGAPMNLLSGRG